MYASLMLETIFFLNNDFNIQRTIRKIMISYYTWEDIKAFF